MAKLVGYFRGAAVVVLSAVCLITAYLSIAYGIEHWPKPKSRIELRAEKSCGFSVEDVELSKGDLCAIRELKKRCSELDSCFVDCFTSGAGIDIAGGCGHICNYGWKIDWKPPKNVPQCFGEGDKSFLPI